MRSTLLISYENTAALVNSLNLGCCEPQAVQFHFSLVGLIPPLALSLALSKEEISLALNSCVCHLLFHPLFSAQPRWFSL